MPAELDEKTGCGWRNRFDSAKSSSYRKNGTHFLDILSTGAEAEGYIGIDTITLGDANGLTVPSQTFGQATRAEFKPNYVYDGVLGIATSSFASSGTTPLLYNAKQQGAIQKNVVTVALIREGIQSPNLLGGTITYGGVDTQNCDPNVKYIQAVDQDPSIVALDRVSFGDFEAPRPAGEVWTVDYGFESTVLVGLTMVTDGLAKVAGAKKDKYSMYKIVCNATVPSLFLTLSGQRFEIPASELIGPIEAAEPDINIFNVYGDDRGPGKFFVGAALGKKYCLVFDYDNVQLGFSTNLYSAPVNG